MHEAINSEKAVTGNNVDAIIQKAADAFEKYKKVTAVGRACFLEKIAGEMEAEAAINNQGKQRK